MASDKERDSIVERLKAQGDFSARDLELHSGALFYASFKALATPTVLSMPLSAAMSKRVAINAAVVNQLENDGRWPTALTNVMQDPPLHYSLDAVRNFLSGVQNFLTHTLPPYQFGWDDAFARTALTQTVLALEASIEDDTN